MVDFFLTDSLSKMHTSTFYIPSDLAVDDSTLTVPFSVLFRPLQP